MFRKIEKNYGLFNRKLAAVLFASTFGFMAFSTAQADPVPAGTIIENRAEATYFNARFGTFETVQSNTVLAQVLPVPALDVSADRFYD